MALFKNREKDRSKRRLGDLNICGSKTSRPRALKNLLSFTLIELIAAMAVFSVIMLVMMKFFGTAQKAWTSSNARSEVFENAKLAMDLISRDLQSAVYTEDIIPFWHSDLGSNPDTTNETKEMISFISSTSVLPNDNCTSSQCEIQYKLAYKITDGGNAGWLMRSATGNKSDANGDNTKWNYSNNFAVGGSGSGKCFTRDGTSNGDLTENYDGKGFSKIIPYVTNLEFMCFAYDPVTKTNQAISPDSESGDFTLNSAGHNNAFPVMVKISLSLMDKNSWKKWIALGGLPSDPAEDDGGEDSDAEEFRKQHERTFTKLVFLQNRTN